MCVAVRGQTPDGSSFALFSVGNRCDLDEQCASGMCLPNFETGESYCSALCDGDDGQCPQPQLPYCQPFDYVFGQYADLWVCTGFLSP